MTWVKICGTTSLEDARAAVEAGADALGFVFAPSPRRISPRDAKKIIAELPEEIVKVGVFVNQSPEIVLDTVSKAGLTAVQLHGDEDAEYIGGLCKLKNDHPLELAVYKAVSMSSVAGNRGGGDLALDYDSSQIRALLLDSGSRSKRGGTGDAFEWQTAAPLVRLLGSRFKIVIAGGLRPENVSKAITLFRPWGVDVVSGVEREPGKKNHEKVRAFVKAAKQADL